MRLPSIVLTVLSLSVSAQEVVDFKLWPLVTPILGVSEKCSKASQEYIEQLNQAFTTTEPLTKEQKNALRRFDSNGRFPFFQEGILQDIAYIDLCDSVLSVVPNCQGTLSNNLRYLRIPRGNANGPGSESGCKAIPDTKYCHNYYQYYVPTTKSLEKSDHLPQTQPHNPKQILDGFHVGAEAPVSLSNFSSFYADFDFKQRNYSSSLDPSKLINLYDILVERNSYFKEAHQHLTSLFDNQTLFPQKNNVDKIFGILINLWMQVNFGNGVGQFGFSFPFAYQGMCYPTDCSIEDIEINSLIFNIQFLNEGMGVIISSPVMNEGFGKYLQMDFDELKRQSVGCSDSEAYSGEFSTAHIAVISVLAIIGALILVGTAMDLREDKNPAVFYQILTAFSLRENIKFVFESPAKGGSARFGCLEGMRSLSMTWVILGHHFLFGQSTLHSRNKEYIGYVQGQHGGGLPFEAVMQGEYSVDTFLFIGATLLSYLLLKDLDKSNGWFSSPASFVRMLLFYLNRYLRITIPYALTMAVFIGVMPLAFKDNMDAGRLAYAEAEECKRVMGYNMAYINIFPDYNGACMGQTWYLSCDMLLFVVSPLLIYPLWTGKFGTGFKVVSILWWSVVFGASCSFAYWYTMNYEKYSRWEGEYKLPSYNFSPWGWRSQCYIIGILTGYILYLTKDKPVVIDRKFNCLVWFNAIVLGLLLVYRPYRDFRITSENIWDKVEGRSFYAFRKAGWGLCLMWVTFSCCRGYGGIINDFLSWNFWLPISKISFMTYLFHMSLNWYFFLLQSYPMDYTMWQLTEMFVPQVWVCLLAGLLGSLTLELPFGKVQKILIQQLLKLVLGGKK